MYRGKFPKVSIVLYKFCKNICLILSSGTGNINIASGEYGYGSGIMFFRRHSCDSDQNLFYINFVKIFVKFSDPGPLILSEENLISDPA